MSDTADRRYEDARMDKLETTIETMKDDLGLVKQKIFNGFSHSIESTENKVNYIDQRNREEHKQLSGKLDKIIWMFSIGALGLIVYEFIKGVV